MAVTPTESTTRAPAESSRATLCPACGYDLRGAASGRCSECGLDIDAAGLDRSGIPWAYRKAMGRSRAFQKTVWMITLDVKPLRHEAAKPQSLRDANRFRRGIVACLALCLAALAVLFIMAGGIEEAVTEMPAIFTAPIPSGLEDDVQVPWSAGIALRPAVFVLLVAHHRATSRSAHAAGHAYVAAATAA